MDVVDVSGELQFGGGADGRARSITDHDQCVVAVDFVSGTGGSALLLIRDVCDPDGNGLARLLEDGLGVAPGSQPSEPLLRSWIAGGNVHLAFRLPDGSNGITGLLEESPALAGPWVPSAWPVVDAGDQSGLPPGVKRCEAVGPVTDGPRFFRVRLTL